MCYAYIVYELTAERASVQGAGVPPLHRPHVQLEVVDDVIGGRRCQAVENVPLQDAPASE